MWKEILWHRLKHSKAAGKGFSPLDILRLEGIDLADDVELSTYIDARERYDYLQSKYDRIVADNYEKNKYNDKSKK